MANLFNFTTPDQVRQTKVNNLFGQSMALAQLPRGRGGVAAAGIAGGALGQGLSSTLGAQDPEMIKAQARQNAMQEVDKLGIDISADPKGYLKAAGKALLDAGDREGAYAVSQQLSSILAAESKSSLEERKVGAQEMNAEASMIRALAGPAPRKQAQWERLMELERMSTEGALNTKDQAELDAHRRSLYTAPPQHTIKNVSAYLDSTGFTEGMGPKEKKAVASMVATAETTMLRNNPSISPEEARERAIQSVDAQMETKPRTIFGIEIPFTEKKTFRPPQLPENLKKGESGVFGQYEWRRNEDGSLQRRRID